VLRAQLRVEAVLPPEQRARTGWTVMVEFAGTRVVIGRGGVNTCFFTFGDGERRIDYPAKLLRALDLYARQSYPLYRIRDRNDRVMRQMFSSAKIREVSPEKGWVIHGVDADDQEQTLYVARVNVRGELDWIKR
jgi:hypothetical protein